MPSASESAISPVFLLSGKPDNQPARTVVGAAQGTWHDQSGTMVPTGAGYPPAHSLETFGTAPTMC
jgi:hypothetical protein